MSKRQADNSEVDNSEVDNSEVDNGVTTLPTVDGVGETLDRLAALATSRGMKLFARIDFGQDAAAAGLTLKPMQLLILGNPASGTPLLAAAPSAGLDLPLKVLAWQDDSGRNWLSFNAPEYLRQRHGFPAALTANIAGLAALAQAAARGG
jgi:uncharacterized protein (DUF302 family)